MPFDQTLATRIRKVLAVRTDTVEKQMFGGLCFMIRGHMACGLVGSSLMVRLDPQTADRLADEPHVRPMDFTGRPMRGYLYVDTEGLTTPRSLGQWIDRCVVSAEARPRKGAPKKKSKRR